VSCVGADEKTSHWCAQGWVLTDGGISVEEMDEECGGVRIKTVDKLYRLRTYRGLFADRCVRSTCKRYE